MHPNPTVRNLLIEKLDNINRVKLIEPLEYYELVYLMKISNVRFLQQMVQQTIKANVMNLMFAHMYC